MIRFPKTDADGNTIRVEGQKSIVDKICASIEAMVSDQESQTTDIAEVKPDKHRLLIGRGGETIKDLQERSGCHVNILGESKSVSGLRPVNLIGSPEAVRVAKDLILEIVDSDNKGGAGGAGSGSNSVAPGRDRGFERGGRGGNMGMNPMGGMGMNMPMGNNMMGMGGGMMGMGGNMGMMGGMRKFLIPF